MSENTQGYALDWDSEIDSDGSGEYVILPEGDYSFTVTAFERKQYPGSAKIPPCKKATVTLQVKTDDGETATVFYDLILYSTLMWKIAAFFRSIGQKKQGEAFRPNWNAVIGATGKAHFKPRTYTKKDGSEGQANDVERFYDAEETTPAWTAPKPQGAPAWNGGKFA